MDGQSGCGGDSTAIHTFCDMVSIQGMESNCLSPTQFALALPFTHFVTWFAYQEWSQTVLVQHNLHYFSIQGQSNRSAVTLFLIGDLEEGLGNCIT